jgi:hypothetical protein
MAIRRYVANADTTITNAYKQDLVTRGTGSNMGASDVSEIFTIYGQASSASAEKARILTKFPTSDISTDRTNGTIPVSGSVSFYLRLYNTPHSQTLPKNYDLYVSAISSSWEEGTGLDMEGYTDKTHNETGANWEIAASGTVATATATDCIDTTGVEAASADCSFTILIPSSAGGLGGTAITFLLDDSESSDPAEGANKIAIATAGNSDAAKAALLIKAINGTADSLIDFASSGNGQSGYDIGVTAAEGSSDTQITLTMDTHGARGNRY